jgi:zinc protease
LTIAGDFDVNQTKIWVEKILGEITRSSYSKKWKTVGNLNETKKLYYEDFACTATHTSGPSVYEYHPDSYARSTC